MKLRLLAVLVPLVFAACSSPPAPPMVLADDDHRWVTREEFQASSWKALPSVKSWVVEPNGVAVTLADGRVARLGFVANAVVRWWVPAAAGEAPFSPGAVYPPFSGLTLKIKEEENTLVLDTPSLGVRLRLKDLSWTIIRGDKTVVNGLAPRAAGRRLVQAFDAKDAARWLSLGAAGGSQFWVGSELGTGPIAAPGLWGAGAAVPFEIALDNSYQTYTRTGDEVSIGALNGGLDLLIAAAPDPGSVVQAMTGVLGRPPLPPQWAFSTALNLPASEPGAFVRQAKLSIQTAVGPFAARPSFRSVGDPFENPAADGFVLAPLPGRRDWNAPLTDNGAPAPLARMNNRLAGLETTRIESEWLAQNPGSRPFVLAGSGSWGSIRHSQNIVTAESGKERLAEVLLRGALGLGTPAARIDLTPLLVPETRTATYQNLLNWLLNPYLILDAGPNPAAFWKALPETDRKRLKAILDRRSEFKPLFVQSARDAALTGRPAWRPVWFASSAADAFTGDEFLLGDSLLSAPVTGTSRSVYLPGPGVWFDFWSGEEFGGGRRYDIEARPDKPILFARGGAVVPVREAEAFLDEDVYNALTVHVFPGGRGVGTYYLDDGRTEAWRSGGAWETRLSYDFTQKEMSLEHIPSTTGTVKPDPYLLYRIHNVFRPKQVKVEGKAVPLFGDSWGITDSDRSAAWYESDHTLLIKTFKPEKAQTVVVSF